jgi:hypothetical protein
VTLAMPDPGTHRMADPVTRMRVALMLAALFVLAVSSVAVLGRPGGFFTPEELRNVSNLPIAPPQIQRRIAPPMSDASDLDEQIAQLETLLRGTPVQPSPGSTR